MALWAKNKNQASYMFMFYVTLYFVYNTHKWYFITNNNFAV